MDIRLPYEMIALDNGLRVIVHEDHRTPLVSTNVWYHVGSKDEVPGRTGLAHLFEHLMFSGSQHVPEGQFDQLLEAAGAANNGSTSPDRTNYWEVMPSHALELALYLEADRMGGLLPALTQSHLDAQRDVVKNERRQSYENRPYGLASETLLAALYPPTHPYHWPVIGSMADLSAATLDDVRAFFRTFYAPNNATIAVAGDTNVARVRGAVERYFGDIPRGVQVNPPALPLATLAADRRIVIEDEVSLPRLYMAWHSPAAFADGDAALDAAGSILAVGRASRLHRKLVYEQQIAQSVTAYQSASLLGSTFRVIVTARPAVGLTTLEHVARAEIDAIAAHGITDEELERARNGVETAFIDALQNVGGFGGRADQLNMYLYHVGEPDWAAHDLARYYALTRDNVRAAVADHILRPAVILSVIPQGRHDLAAA
jgi:zinc protease